MLAAGENGVAGLDGFWNPGRAHEDVVETRSERHCLHLRLSYGRGREAVGCDGLREVEWPAFALRHYPPGAPFRHATARPADWVGVRLSEARLEELIAEAGATRRRPLQHRSCPAAGQLAMRLRRRAMAGRRHSDHLLDDALWVEFAAAAVRAMIGADAEPARIAMTRRTLDRVLDYVESHLGERVTLAQLAAAAKLSPFHFARAFKATTGHAPYEYVRDRRLHRARDLLGRTDEPLARVAVETGFCSQSHLATRFKNAMGVAPNAYRRQRRGLRSLG